MKKTSNRGFIKSYLRSCIKFTILVTNLLLPIKVILRSVKMQKFSNSNDIVSFILIFYYKSLCFILGEFATILKFNLGYFKK